MRGSETAAAILVGWALGAGVTTCTENPVPSPVAAPEAASGGVCLPVDWACCKEVITEPTCRPDGFYSCDEGYETCDPEAGAP